MIPSPAFSSSGTGSVDVAGFSWQVTVQVSDCDEYHNEGSVMYPFPVFAEFTYTELLFEVGEMGLTVPPEG